MTANPQAAKTASEIQIALFQKSMRLSDAQLLVLVLGTGATRYAKEWPKKTWTAIELAQRLLDMAGGRLEHLVASARRSDFDRRRYALGEVLGCRLLATVELAHRWRQGFEGGGDLTVHEDGDIEIRQRVLERDAGLTEGELIAVLVSHYSFSQRAASIFARYSSAEDLMRTLTPASYRQARLEGIWPLEGDSTKQSACRLLAAIELARRHRARSGFERHALEPGSLGLSSPYLVKLLDPESPLDRPTRQKLLANVRSNPQMAEDFNQLDRLADDAGTDDVFLAIRHHAMFEALNETSDWVDPAEVVGEPVPFAALLTIAEARISGSTGDPARLLKVREPLEAAELAAARGPLIPFVAALEELAVSESGLERAFEEARRRFTSRGSPPGPTAVAKTGSGKSTAVSLSPEAHG